ncbi:uncharacterized protein LOC132716954 [Ruditapes philippinarum]|uniref:uncharacterized protein LOC132716954 n=1 Tax=Ruditapes philippinarum TaxID=129788 RepID=UPI00295B7A6E|nr:uncharacterized protein LOC132716954 [Ruditapes philippinarum]XP_060556290.1 uncharacterized protein LOC132716954 [Ruditapes philippinarum]
MASGGPFQSPDNRVHMFRLQMLIMDGGLLVFRNIVDKTLADKGMTLSECLDNEKSTIETLKRQRIINQFQYKILFPHGKNPATTDMDITLLMCLLRNLDLFSSIDEADLNLLRNSRNKLSHMASTTEIQEKEFKDMWTDIEEILVRHSTPDLNIQETIVGYMTCPLDNEREKMLQKEIEKWGEYEAEIIGVKEDVTEVKKKMTEVEGNVIKVEKEMTGLKQDFTQVKEGLDNLKAGDYHKQTKEEIYQSRKADLRDSLITFYRKRHSHIFLSPLFEEKDTPLASFCIRPELSSIDSNDVKRPVKSLSEMFKTKKREIYVLADAGLGKTVFSKYLANVWYQAHCPDKNFRLFLKDDIDCMQEFDFIFLVFLRDAGNVCSIDELIFEKIVPELGVEEPLSKDDLLKILKHEKCLVILDGLDEWTHPDNECKRSAKPSIPHRNDREKCTVLTTTRQWKLGVLELDSCQLGKKVELTGLSSKSADKLIQRMIQEWKSPPNKNALDSDVREFKETIKKRQNVELVVVPLLLIYTICLWCKGFDIGNSKCDLYIKIVEFLLSRTIKIHGKLKQSKKIPSSGILSQCLDSFAEYEKCKQNIPLLMHIGKLAYYTLFNETKENTLVFDGSIAREYLSTDEMNFTLATGMLSESTSNAPYKKLSKVWFSHKTIQEFFAAIFLSFQENDPKLKRKSNQDILDMSNICEFISGLNADRMFKLSNYFMSVINEDEETRRYRTLTGFTFVYYTPLYNIQTMFMSCLQEMPESENIQLCLQDFFINDSTVHSEQLQRLLKQNKANVKSLSIRTFNNSRSEIIDSFSLTDLSDIQQLWYCGDEEEAEINRILFPSLQAVSLFYCTWTNDEENVSAILARLQNLQFLHIESLTLSHKILETIFNFISGQKSLKELTLEQLHCKEHGCRDCKGLNLDLDLSQHSTLSKLHLQWLPGRLQLNITTPSLVNVTLKNINVNERSLLLSRDMLKIKHAELEGIEMPAGSLQNFITVLENLPQSVKVNMFTKFSCKLDIGGLRFVFKTIKPSTE